MKIKIGISNRHVHLTKEDKDILFGNGYELNKRNDLTQTGEYASDETVTLENNDKFLEYVRVVGPLRKYTQVEVLKKDCAYLEINPPLRDSGDLVNSESITIIGPKGKIKRDNCCIIANNHIHVNNNDKVGYNNGEVVKVFYKGKKIDNVHIKRRDDFVLEFHINKDEALIYGMENGEDVELM